MGCYQTVIGVDNGSKRLVVRGDVKFLLSKGINLFLNPKIWCKILIFMKKGCLSMDGNTRDRIKQRISEKMEGILERRINSVDQEMHALYETNPFGSRLVPSEIWKSSKFERSFVTSFGQGVFEQIAYEIAIGSGAFAENQHLEIVTLNTWQDEAISNLLADQRGSDTLGLPNWEVELADIMLLNNPRHVDVETRFDLYIRRPNGFEEYYSLKTVKPNLDQTEIAKRDMLRIMAAKPGCKAFLGLPYNPDGEGRPYTWGMPRKLFDMNACPAVLIGSNFWNAVGANENTYSELLAVFDEIGTIFQGRIRTEYLQR